MTPTRFGSDTNWLATLTPVFGSPWSSPETATNLMPAALTASDALACVDREVGAALHTLAERDRASGQRSTDADLDRLDLLVRVGRGLTTGAATRGDHRERHKHRDGSEHTLLAHLHGSSLAP